jgi:hypothetical protein
MPDVVAHTNSFSEKSGFQLFSYDRQMTTADLEQIVDFIKAYADMALGTLGQTF